MKVFTLKIKKNKKKASQVERSKLSYFPIIATIFVMTSEIELKM